MTEKAEHQSTKRESLLRRLGVKALGTFCFFVIVVCILLPGTGGLKRAISGQVPVSDVLAFAACLVFASFAAAALLDWEKRRKAGD